MNNQSQTPSQHLVVALKYRPQSFSSLVGQDHIATALGNAIRQNRVGHAYLFTGARGVGKTSSARIFAKCLNCKDGPLPEPCEACEACEAISLGEDVDVIEIDGASNRGIDEIRQLRANASIRPSRSPFKIYIIDEVHMLTKEAFNALLKTLEEPPPHVKFIFCTTDPEKIPITVLSRCQRFDFSPVQTNEIAGRLKMIATNEGVEIDEPAIMLLARRANGSMRDSQSLLEQMLSFSDKHISVEDVHQLLGTADISRIAELVQAMADHDAAKAMNLVHQGICQGVDAGQLMGQLLGYYRDMMAVRVQSSEETLLHCAGSDLQQLRSLAEQYGLETILSTVQILDATLVRMQSSLHGRTLLEVAVVRVCNLEHLDSLSDLVASLSGAGSSSSGSAKIKPSGRPRVAMKQVTPESTGGKKKEVSPDETTTSETMTVSARAAQSAAEQAQHVSHQSTQAPVNQAQVANRSGQAPSNEQHPDKPAEDATQSSAASTPFSTKSAEEIWKQVLSHMGDDMTADMASDYTSVNMADENRIVVTLADKVNKEFCSKADRKQLFEDHLQTVTGKRIRIDFAATERSASKAASQPKLSRVQQLRKLQEHGFVADAMQMFDAEVTGFQEIRRRKT